MTTKGSVNCLDNNLSVQIIGNIMKILEIIHGYPPEYNAGSENYTEAVVNELMKRDHEVAIFCREENQFLEEYHLRTSHIGSEGQITKFVINMARNKDRFLHSKVDSALRKVVDIFNPDVAHIEHLNHLSLTIPSVLKEQSIPMIYTLHDFWLMCPRGQFLQFNSEGEPWKSCDGQDDLKCAKICYSRYHTGDPDGNKDIGYWTSWVSTRMNYARMAVKQIDRFVAPSRTVLEYFTSYFPEARKKVSYLDYGFDLSRLRGRKRKLELMPFVFGYLGTHIPGKGIDYLIKAFCAIRGKALLRIWGRTKSEYTPYLKKLDQDTLHNSENRIEWMGEFESERIVEQVFNNVDAIVTPSIWLENSPLVIHEAQQARVPVITANVGGMAEYVKDGVNGISFEFRSIESLTSALQKAMENPKRVAELGDRGYLLSKNGTVQSISEHVDSLLNLFERMIEDR